MSTPSETTALPMTRASSRHRGSPIVACRWHARLPGRYGVIVMNAGFFPVLIGLSAVLVAVLIGVTVPES
jgi:hypothetical protein